MDCKLFVRVVVGFKQEKGETNLATKTLLISSDFYFGIQVKKSLTVCREICTRKRQKLLFGSDRVILVLFRCKTSKMTLSLLHLHPGLMTTIKNVDFDRSSFCNSLISPSHHYIIAPLIPDGVVIVVVVMDSLNNPNYFRNSVQLDLSVSLQHKRFVWQDIFNRSFRIIYRWY